MRDHQRPGGLHHRPIGGTSEFEEELEADVQKTFMAADESCHSCGNRRYDDEPDCPHCGAEYHGKPRYQSRIGLLILIIIGLKLAYFALQSMASSI